MGDFIYNLIQEINFDLIKNITLTVVSFLGSFWMIFLPIKIYRFNRRIDNINDEIEFKKESLNKMEIEKIDEALFDLISVCKRDVMGQEYRKIEQEIEKLERKKKNLLEKISIYKIFKK